MDIRTGLKKSDGFTGAFDFFFSCRSLKMETLPRG
jgi:hypothetical protein